MNFDKSKVYTALNADELQLGSKIIVADTIGELKSSVSNNENPKELLKIDNDYTQYRFGTGCSSYAFAYLVDKSKCVELKWTDLKVGDIIRYNEVAAMVTAIDSDDDDYDYHVYAGNDWIHDNDLKYWDKVDK